MLLCKKSGEDSIESTNSEFTFTGYEKPVSVNKAYRNVPGKGRIKTGDYKRLKTYCINEMETHYKEDRKKFLSYLSGNQFNIHTSLVVQVPEKLYYVQTGANKGEISSRAGDCSSYRKVIQDTVFGWLSLDDKYSRPEFTDLVPAEDDRWSFIFSLKAKLWT